MDNIYVYCMKFGKDGGIVEHISSEYEPRRNGGILVTWKTESGKITRSVLPSKPGIKTENYRVWFPTPNREKAKELFLETIDERRNKILKELDDNRLRRDQIERG